MKSIDSLIETSLHTADAADRMQAADAAFAAHFIALTGAAQASCWRSLTHAEKFRLVVRRIEQIGKAWLPSVVEEFIAKYDIQFRAGPVEAAVEGALERLALDNAQHARAAAAADEPKDAAYFRRAATSFTNALIEYRKGIRPDVLSSRAQLLPSRRAGEAPHLVTMDGDWTCSCTAGSSMHWPIALVIGIEVAMDDMQRYDDPPGDNPLGDDEGDSLPSRAIGDRIAQARRNYAYAA